MANELAKLVDDLGRQMGLDGLSLDENGSASLEIDSVVLNLDSDDDGRTLVLHAWVGDAPLRDQTPDEFYETLLRANFFHLGTGGATLGMDREQGYVALVQRVAVAGQSAADLLGVVEQFVNFAEAWTQRVAELSAGGSVNRPSEGAESAGMLRI